MNMNDLGSVALASAASPLSTPIHGALLLRGRVLMLYAGAGNKFVSRHLELHPGGQLRVLLDGTTEAQTIIDLRGCILADYPENPVLGFSLCRTTESDPYSPSRLGQFLFMCLNVEDKRRWMAALQEQIWSVTASNSPHANSMGAAAPCGPGGGDASSTSGDVVVASAAATSGSAGDGNSPTESSAGAPPPSGVSATTGHATSTVKQSRFNQIRFNKSNYVIDRGFRPPLLQGFLLKRTGNFLQDYVVRWCELRDRVSTETTSLGGVVYASYIMAPPGEWSFVPMRIDTAVTRHDTKFRISVAGPNQDTVFFKFESRETADEWFQSLEMLVQRAKIENDPQFAMEMRLGRDAAASSSAKAAEHDLAETITNAQAMQAKQRELREMEVDVAEGDDDGANAQRGPMLGSDKIAYDSDDDEPSPNTIDGVGGEHGSGGSMLSPEEEDTEYEIQDLESDTPKRVHYITMLYALDRPIHADRDSHSMLPLLQEVIASPPSRFRSNVSPYVPRKSPAASQGGGTTRSAFPDVSFDVDDTQREEQHRRDDGEGEVDPATVEDVLLRFERRMAMSAEVLGPSAIVSRLLRELDQDASDLRGVALHLVDTFPRQVKAALLATRLDAALAEFQALRESVLVRQDMAKFREDFRISHATATAGAVASSVAAMKHHQQKDKDKDSMTVDAALKAINRATIEGDSSGSETTHKVRDAIQFLTHFLSQFRENFDVFDDAGYVIEEVGGAIERGNQFLQEL